MCWWCQNFRKELQTVPPFEKEELIFAKGFKQCLRLKVKNILQLNFSGQYLCPGKEKIEEKIIHNAFLTVTLFKKEKRINLGEKEIEVLPDGTSVQMPSCQYLR
jgi:hypothetical protein